MDYEKLHKDTITKLQEMVNSGKITVEIACSICADFVPESEDERIRKELIAMVRLSCTNGDDADKKIAWLKKQSIPQVRTGLEWVNTIDDACDKRYSEEYAHGEYCHEQSFKWGFQEGVDWLEKQGEQILANPAKTCKDGQKPAAWSEEDEKLYKSALWHIKNSCGNGGKNSGEFEVYNWLKSIKDRVQPKQEWSEEDKKALKVVTDVFEQYGVHLLNYPAFVHWLKTLPNRITFNPYWKPSDEQMEALSYEVDAWDEDSANGQNLRSLYEQLKKLREE